ncbi:GNAT family N-acetyltransferase [Acidaminobacterium chupaoyuni]
MDGIRAAILQDHQAIHEIFCQIHALHAQARPDIYRASADPLPFSQWQEMLSSADDFLWVFEKNQEIAGVCWAQLRDIPAAPLTCARRLLRIEALGVGEPYRHQKIATQLWQAALEQARLLQVQSVELQVWNFNRPAMEFYQRLGMVPRAELMEFPLSLQ